MMVTSIISSSQVRTYGEPRCRYAAMENVKRFQTPMDIVSKIPAKKTNAAQTVILLILGKGKLNFRKKTILATLIRVLHC